MELPGVLIDLLNELYVPYDWSIHDYYTICPRIQLIGRSGVYCGEPDARACNECLAHLGDDQGRPVNAPIETWRAGFSRHLAKARRIFAPSEDARKRITSHFPHVKVLLRPHPETFPALETLVAGSRLGETVHVAVLGTIVRAKGSEKLLACARDARARRLPLRFHVLGSTDRDVAFRRLGNVQLTGRYREEEAFVRLAGLGCDLAFLPSVSPETFMFTLSLAMHARLYVVCFDLGAQVERLKAWGWGRALPLHSSPEAINRILQSAGAWLKSNPVSPPPPAPAQYRDLLTSYYDFTQEERDRLVRGPRLLDELSAEPDPHVSRRDHAHLHERHC
jgi:glycosyltransferase involved in cell wall biosynthesis